MIGDDALVALPAIFVRFFNLWMDDLVYNWLVFLSAYFLGSATCLLGCLLRPCLAGCLVLGCSASLSQWLPACLTSASSGIALMTTASQP
jgi:hypothetical protein